MIEDLSENEKSIILDRFIKIIEKEGKEKSKIYGYTQILELLNNIAVLEGFLYCPYCKRLKK
jgi:hypothetical protein